MTSYFTPKETSCKCDCGFDITANMLRKINQIRADYGHPIELTCGARCPTHNKAVGGAPSSYHMRGEAVDMVRTPELTKFILDNLQTYNLRMESLDATPTWIHIDLGYKGTGLRIFNVKKPKEQP